jgi:hypothetical protein
MFVRQVLKIRNKLLTFDNSCDILGLPGGVRIMKSETSARITLWVNRTLIALLFVAPFLLPWALRRWIIGPVNAAALYAAFYCCFPAVLLALLTMDKLMRNILNRQVFIPGNIRLIRRVRWCRLAVSLICLPASFVYLPLLCMVLVMGFLGLVVSVVKSVMAAAVELREESDLTI